MSHVDAQAFPWIEIDHQALRYNLAVVRIRAPTSRVWAVVKANAYGHGAIEVAKALTQADGLAVSRVEEGVNLRASGERRPILVLSGFVNAEELREARANALHTVLHHDSQLVCLKASRPSDLEHLWVKVDTGMHRLGFPPAQVPGIIQYLNDLRGVTWRPPLLTHLANADRWQDPSVDAQLRTLTCLPQSQGVELSIANSGGILGFPETHAHWVRPGIMLYGVSPFAADQGPLRGLRPVMRFATRVVALNQYQAGECIGYGGTFRCPEPMTVAVLRAGYGDGYPRHAPTGTPVLIRGRRLPLIGRVSMDLITVDARDCPAIAVGDEAVLWGAELPVEIIADWASTIAYELLCGVTARVRMYHVERLMDGPGHGV